MGQARQGDAVEERSYYGPFHRHADIGMGWEWLAVPDGETPPPLSQEPPPKRPAQHSRPVPAKPVRDSQPLPGEDEDDPQGFFSGGDETR